MSTANTQQKLRCGTPARDLNALLDYRLGATDALAPARAQQLSQHVADCPYCRQTLDYLQGLHSSAVTAITEEESALAQQPWLDRLLHNLVLDTLPGRTIPLAPPSPERVLDQTEGSLRALIRAQASGPDAIVVSTRIDGDLDRFDAPCTIEVTLHVRLGSRIPEVVEDVRRRITQTIATSTSLALQAISVVVADTFGTGHTEPTDQADQADGKEQ
ncbi:MAG: hypothetical protein E7A62_07680 [Actinomycetaceae bacterium]|nr:hypothetical protein [Actinomycetaceae bacterium]MDU0970856.1 hypothetical protein [Actinomycetaceae bacterium]